MFTIAGAGQGIGGAADQFMFLYQRLTGDGTVTMRLLSLAGPTTMEAGLTIRESLTASARHASLLASATGLTFRTRTQTSGGTTSTAKPRSTWLRLERAGPVVTAWISSDGAQWTIAATQTLTLPSTAYVGIAVTSRSVSALATATVASMSVVNTTPSLPANWTSSDVGAASSAGTASYSNGSFVASSAGAGFAVAADGFRFVYARVRGDAKLVARVVASEGRAGRQAGVVLRTSLDANAGVMALVADDAGILLVKRAAAGQAAVLSRVATAVAPVWLQLDRTASIVSMSYSTDGATWRTVGSTGVSFGSELYAGLAVAAGPNGGLAAAAFDRLSLVSVSANAPPVVSLTKPVNGQIVIEGDAVAMAANASDPDDLVARVEFRVNGTRVATDMVAPYAASWTAGIPGVYTVVAAAADFDGAVTTSLPALVTVAPRTVSGSSTGTTAIGPWRLAFDVSADHATLDRYVLDIYSTLSGARVLSRDLGKPAPVNGTCTVDIDTLVDALPAGLYAGVVRAVASWGTGVSLPYSFSK